MKRFVHPLKHQDACNDSMGACICGILAGRDNPHLGFIWDEEAQEYRDKTQDDLDWPECAA